MARLQPEGPEAAPEGGAALRAPHPKEVDKPKVYDGNAATWRLWAVAFKRFLRRNDERWPALLEAVEKLQGQPIEADDEELVEYLVPGPNAHGALEILAKRVHGNLHEGPGS